MNNLKPVWSKVIAVGFVAVLAFAWGYRATLLNVLEYLKTNKEWLFSGAGVSAILVLGGLIYRHWNRRHRSASRSDTRMMVQRVESTEQVALLPTPPVTASSGVLPQPISPVSIAAMAPASTYRGGRISGLTVTDVVEGIRNAPPLQRPGVAKHYRGIVVQWETVFVTAEVADDDGVIRVTLEPAKEHFVTTFCKVKLSDYPELGILASGAPIRVTARIAQIDVFGAELEDAELFIHPAAR